MDFIDKCNLSILFISSDLVCITASSDWNFNHKAEIFTISKEASHGNDDLLEKHFINCVIYYFLIGQMAIMNHSEKKIMKLRIVMLTIGYVAAAPSPVDSWACIFNFTEFSSSNWRCAFPFSIVLKFSLLRTTRIKHQIYKDTQLDVDRDSQFRIWNATDLFYICVSFPTNLKFIISS